MKTNRHNIKIVGRVTYGKGLGHHFGFPTANLIPTAETEEVEGGVWAGYAEVAGRRHIAVVNIGVSPSVVEGGVKRVEAHIVDFEGDIYGCEISLTLCYHLRPERRFASRELLCEQIGRDRTEAIRLMRSEQESTNN